MTLSISPKEMTRGATGQQADTAEPAWLVMARRASDCMAAAVLENDLEVSSKGFYDAVLIAACRELELNGGIDALMRPEVIQVFEVAGPAYIQARIVDILEHGLFGPLGWSRLQTVHDLENSLGVPAYVCPRLDEVILADRAESGLEREREEMHRRAMLDYRLTQHLPPLILIHPADRMPVAAGFIGAYVRKADLSTMTRETLAAQLCLTYEIAYGEALEVFAELSSSEISGLNIESTSLLYRNADLAGFRAALEAMRSAVRGEDAPKGQATLDDIRGFGEAERVARMMIEDMKRFDRGELTWRDVTSSMLLHGEPGTGKTHLARAMGASFPGMSTFFTSLAQMQAAGQAHGGTMIKEMRRIFSEARRAAPALIFIDEIDAAGSRGNSSDHNQFYMTSIINALLEVMNGENREGVLVVAACNHIDSIDPALLREGRFDHKVEMMLPGAVGAGSILQGSLPAHIPVDDVLDVAIGQTPAWIDAAVRKAKAAARHDGVELTAEMLRRELMPITWRRADILWRTAVHECGHAIVATAMGHKQVTRIVVRANGGGACYMRGGHGEQLIEDLEAEIAILMAGKMAERIVTGTHSGGIGGSRQSDLARATRIAIAMEAQLGLADEAGPYYDGRDDKWLADPAASARVRDRLQRGEEMARAVLEENEDRLRRMAEALQTERVFEKGAVSSWMQGVIIAKMRAA